MGVFNYVKYTDVCVSCGTEMTTYNFQTKICERPLMMQPIEVWESYTFSGFCPNCSHIHDYEVDADVEVTVNIKKLDVQLVKDESLESVRQKIFGTVAQ